MNILYLKLSPHRHYHLGPNFGKVLGLDIDKQPSQEAKDAARALAATAAPCRAHHAVTLSALATRVVDFKVETPTGAVEIVVLTINGARGFEIPVFSLTLDISLTPNSEFTIQSMSEHVYMVLMTPVLAQLVGPDNRWRCDAHIVDGQRCRLKRIDDGRWCPFHRDQHVLLHDEELGRRKGWYTEVKEDKEYMGQTREQVLDCYNEIQETLGLRTLITEVLYQGIEDAGHKDFVDVTTQNRGNVHFHLKGFLRHDGSGREAVMACLYRFLVMAGRRETNPGSEKVRRRELTVKLADVRKIRDFQGGYPTPSVFFLLTAPPDRGIMHDRFLARANRIGNLPPWKTREEIILEIPVEQRTEAELDYLEMKAFGFAEDRERRAKKIEFWRLIELGANRTPQEDARLDELGKDPELFPPEEDYGEEGERQQQEEEEDLMEE
jgi:hypothetical protein